MAKASLPTIQVVAESGIMDPQNYLLGHTELKIQAAFGVLDFVVVEVGDWLPADHGHMA